MQRRRRLVLLTVGSAAVTQVRATGCWRACAKHPGWRVILLVLRQAFHLAHPLVRPRPPPALASCQRRALGAPGMVDGAASAAAAGPCVSLLGARASSAAEHKSKRLFVALELAERDKAALTRAVDALKAGVVPFPVFCRCNARTPHGIRMRPPPQVCETCFV